MNNKQIEEIINEAKSRNVLAKDPNKLRENWLREALTQVHNSAIEGCVEMIKDEFIPPNYEGKPVLSELEMFLKQKLENLKIK